VDALPLPPALTPPPAPVARRARWPYAVGVVGLLLAALLGVAGGAASSVDDAAGIAAQLRSEGHYGRACALYRQVAARTGFLYLLARGTVAAAPIEDQRTRLSWAKALAAGGRVDAALRLTEGVTEPALRGSAARERAALLLTAAQAAASAGTFDTAVRRLQQLQALSRQGSAAAGEVASLMPAFEIAEAQMFISRGDGADAVALLDRLAATAGAAQTQAQQLLPDALLAAAQEELGQLSYVEAAASLHRLVDAYAGTNAAHAARLLLLSREPVAGTLATRSGAPVTGQVRLSSNFRQLGSGYLTSGPFYYSHTSPSGDFVVEGVPQGGPYVLEVFHNGGWTTLIDPATGRPADPVRVDAPAPVDLTFIVLPA
jgi:hypothetical protein